MDTSATRLQRKWSNESPTRRSYVVGIPSGWLVYTSQNVCMAELTRDNGWTAEHATAIRDLLDGDPIRATIKTKPNSKA